MKEQRPAYLQQIAQEDWEKTPASVKKLVEEMAQHIEKHEEQLAQLLAGQQQLLEKVNSSSKNSSSPPSQDSLGFSKKPRKQKNSKKRRGQPGHESHSRDLYPSSVTFRIEQVVNKLNHPEE